MDCGKNSSHKSIGEKNHMTNAWLIIQILKPMKMSNGQQRKNCFVVTKEMIEKQNEYVSRRTIHNDRHREGFYVIPKSFKYETLSIMAARLVQRLDCRRFPSSDEFYVWTVGWPNYQNDRI